MSDRAFAAAPRAVGATLVVAVALAAAGCGGGETPMRLGVLTDCQGPLRGIGDGELSGAEMPLLAAGARLRGTGPGGGVTEATVAGRKVQLVIGCAESGEYDVFISEARRLVEKEHVDAVVGGDGVVIRDVARLYPTVPFVSTFWDEQEITLRQPVANLYRFTIDAAQETAGLGGYAYHRLGWRRASILAGDSDQGWANAAAFTAEFCALGGTIVNRVYRSALLPQAHIAADVLVGRPDGVALLLTPYEDPRETTRELLARTSRPSRQLLFAAPLIEDPTLVKSLGSRIDGIVSTSWIPATAPTQRLKSYRKRYAASFPGLPPSFANLSFVAGYADSVQAVLTAFERAGGDLSNSRNRLRAELARLRLELPRGNVRLDRNRQAITDVPLLRLRVRDGKFSEEPVGVSRQVEQSFGGLLSNAPPPGPGSQPCVKATPPSWAQRP